jgi:hypothetical protein
MGEELGNTIQNHQVGYAPFHVYEQAYGVNGNHLMEFISTETKMESLQNKTNTVFKPAADIFYGFNTS